MGILDIFSLKKIKAENEELKLKIDELKGEDYFSIQNKIKIVKEEIEYRERESAEKIAFKENESKEKIAIWENKFEERKAFDKLELEKLARDIEALNSESEKLSKNLNTQSKKISRIKEIYKAVDYSINQYLEYVPESIKITPESIGELENFSPSVMLKLHCMDIKDLRKAYKDNDKAINKVLEQYKSRYTTKANKAIYELMVIALRAELQNILYNLKYEKLDKSIDDLKMVTQKYVKVAGEGNQSIVGTLSKFIGEVEYLFINAIKIEYNYYVKKEQAKQEQLAIREQMRQEAEERKALEQERKRVEKEEEKYQSEISKIRDAMSSVKDDSELKKLQQRILELQSQLSDVMLKKEEIANLQNGKAGNVYIISNLGSFGEDVFKIGMTRRLEPQDRINELGSASVPFKFDVHSFIFSEDAVSLENKLHQILNNKRLNKVNLRKEFFKTSLDELEQIVLDIEPTAEFNKTMIAEEFRQSLSSDEAYTNDFKYESSDDED